MACPESLTGQFLSGTRAIARAGQAAHAVGYVEIEGATQHNLKHVNVKVPLGVFTCVTGVSGSGKSTLVNEVLYKSVANKLHRAKLRPGAHKRVTGLEQLDKIISVDQSPIGRTPRSNPATYIGLFDQIRELFTKTQEARARGYKPGRFSFNVKGGRCEVCRGDGQIKIEMHFLPDIYVPCEQCHGKRYNRETLDIRFKGKNIADVLEMPVEEALEFFAHIPKIARRLQTLHDVGLDYMRLGQPATTLSGGEAQRDQARLRALEGRDRLDALHPRRADHRPALRRHREAARGAAAAGRLGQLGRRHRAQPRRHQDGRPDHRHGARGRRGGRRPDGHRHAGAGRRRRGLLHGPLPARVRHAGRPPGARRSAPQAPARRRLTGRGERRLRLVHPMDAYTRKWRPDPPPRCQVATSCGSTSDDPAVRRTLATLITTLALAAPANAAQSANVEHVAQIPEALTAISANFIGDTMFVSTVTGIYAYDVADPARPRQLGALPMYI